MSAVRNVLLLFESLLALFSHLSHNFAYIRIIISLLLPPGLFYFFCIPFLLTLHTSSALMTVPLKDLSQLFHAVSFNSKAILQFLIISYDLVFDYILSLFCNRNFIR